MLPCRLPSVIVSGARLHALCQPIDYVNSICYENRSAENPDDIRPADAGFAGQFLP